MTLGYIIFNTDFLVGTVYPKGLQWGSEYWTFKERKHSITGRLLVRYSSHDLNTKQKVRYSSHDLNTGLLVRYSSHDLKSELKVRYSGHESCNL